MNILHFLTNSRYRKIFALLGIASIPAISVMLYTLYQTFDQAYSVERRNVGASYLVEHLADMAGRIHMASVAGAQAVLSNYEDFRREVQDLAGGYVVRFGHGRYASAGGIPFAQLVDSLSLDLQKKNRLMAALQQAQKLAQHLLQADQDEALHGGKTPQGEGRLYIAPMLLTESFNHEILSLLQQLEMLGEDVDLYNLNSIEEKRNYLFWCLLGLAVLFIVVCLGLMAQNKDNFKLTSFKGERFLFAMGMLVLIVGVVVPSYLLYHDTRESLLANLRLRLDITARQVEYSLQWQMEKMHDYAKIIGSMPEVERLLSSESAPAPVLVSNLRTVLHTISVTNEDMFGANIFDKDGRMLVCVTDEASAHANRNLPPDVLSRVRHGEFYLNFALSTHSNQQVLQNIVPIYSKEQRFIGAVALEFERKANFFRWKETVAREAQMDIFVFNAQGAVVFSSQEKHYSGLSDTPKPLVGMVRQGLTGPVSFDDGVGHTIIGTLRPVKNFDWTIVVTSKSQSSLGYWRQVLLRSASWDMCALLLSFLLVLYWGRRMRHDLEDAQETFNRLVNNAGAYLWRVDIPAQTFSYGPEWHQTMHYTGTPAAGTIGLAEIFTRVHPDDAAKLQGLMVQKDITDVVSMELRLYDELGEMHWFRMQATVDKSTSDGMPLLVSGVSLDISNQYSLAEALETQRKSAEKLRNSQEQMEAIIEAAELYWFDLDFESGTFAHNAQWVRAWGVPGEAQGGLMPISYIFEHSTPESVERLQNAMRGKKVGECFTVELEHVHPNGERMWGRNVGQILEVDAQGNVLHCAGVGFNLTAQKRAEESEANLRIANARMADIITAAEMHTFDLDMSTGLFVHNGQWVKFWHYPGVEEEGTKDISFVLEHLVPESRDRMQHLLHHTPKDSTYIVDLELDICTGERRWCRQVGRVNAVDEQGYPVRISGAGYDITAWKSMEKSEQMLRQLSSELRSTNERMETMVEAGGLFTFDLNLITGTFSHNAQWCREWEYPGAVEAGTKKFSDFFDTLDPEFYEKGMAMLAHVREGDPFYLELQFTTYKGNKRWCRVVGRIESVDAEGHAQRVLGTGFDITLQKRQQITEEEYKVHLEEMVAVRTAELEESRDQAEAASKAKTVFLSTVSHEIRTPMNAIMGFVHIFERDNLTAEQRQQLDTIRLSAETLLGVINDVLDISKIESGKLELEVRPFQLLRMVESVRSIVDGVAAQKHLQLVLKVAPNVPDYIVGDSQRITQVLMNLLNNAIKFTKEGHVALMVNLRDAHTPDIALPDDADTQAAITDDGKSLVVGFTVEDTGIGISEEQIGRIFQPFMQADSSVTRRYGGTGLGLSISRQLVEIMGGRVVVRSKVGEGSAFDVTVCVGIPDAASRAALESTGTPRQKEDESCLRDKRILVVEDNDINQEIARALLEEHPVCVTIASNGQKAVDIVQQQEFDCIFMDMQMPVMGGIEATERIRALGAENPALAWLRTVPIIAMTANAMTEDKMRCLNAGMNDHIGKPIDPTILLQCLLHWLK